ncbi:MORC family CW-type zinc finger 3 S homeolog [Xenopus laevis]|uniref:MGC83806 protein n=1 Tax=Xenopus laevis TaxID=8355 RepID=Q6NRH8_XENLA|nr:MORC family CW-type zinc finger 3 S homeolog [Xenopus laevis]AAH70772.1 MGC83806 protein [Xenopus laevis]
MAIQATDGIRLSALSPKFLHTNSTSHTWPFSAVAELIDNAYDPDVNAKQIWIDKTVIKSNICLTCTDSGNGMTLDKLHKMLSFGFSDKVAVHGHVPVGLYGNGFKSGSMRLGKDAIVFTKNESGMHVGMLSQSYLEKINAEHVLVPIISFNKHKQLEQTPDSEANLRAITTYSLLNNMKELLAELDAITGRKGTRIIIWNLRRDKRGFPEFDFDYDKYDILIPAEIDGTKRGYKKQERVDQVAPDSDYSLRAYCSILYLKPRMQIILRGQKVQTQLVSKSLALIEKDVYRPQFLQPKTIKIIFGYNCRNKEHYGVMMYHKNRLIKAYVKVGCQLKANNMGVGVVGVVECNFLKPTHNKQDFDYTNEYRLTLSALGFKLNDYWNEMKVKKNSHPLSLPVEDIQKKPDQLWVQCDSCLKWRKVPDAMGKLADKWYCSMNTDPQFRDCTVAEEPEDDDDITHSTYEKTYKRRKSEQLQQMAAEKPTFLFTPQNKEMLPSSGQRFLTPNQSQGTDLNKSCKRPLSNENASAKKQKLNGSDTIDLLQWSDEDEGDVIIIEDNSTAKPKNNLKSNPHPIATEKLNHRSHGAENLNGNDPILTSESIPRGETSAVATQTERETLDFKKEEGSNDYSCQENQPMPDSNLYINCNGIAQYEMDQTHHQDNSVDATDREKESLNRYCEELLLRVKGLEGEVTELRHNQFKKEGSHQVTQTDVSPPNPTDVPSKQLVAQYEEALKEINRLKVQCEMLQNMKAAAGTKPTKPTEDSSDMDDMALQMDSLFRQLDTCSTERDQYKSEAEQLKHQSAQIECQTQQLETQIEQLKHMVQDMAKKESASTSAAKVDEPSLKLRSLRINVAQLLTTLMPDLQLQALNYDVDVIDEILTQVLEQTENQVNEHE